MLERRRRDGRGRNASERRVDVPSVVRDRARGAREGLSPDHGGCGVQVLNAAAALIYCAFPKRYTRVSSRGTTPGSTCACLSRLIVSPPKRCCVPECLAIIVSAQRREAFGLCALESSKCARTASGSVPPIGRFFGPKFQPFVPYSCSAAGQLTGGGILRPRPGCAVRVCRSCYPRHSEVRGGDREETEERERDRDRDRDREEREEREPGKDAAAASCIQVCVGFINGQLLVGVNAFMRDCPLARVCVLTAPCRVWG